MREKLRVGLIGCGAIAENKHIPAIAANRDKAVLAAVSDALPGRAAQLASRLGGGVAAYEDYRELLLDPDIDVVHVCTPNATHAEISIAAMEAGKHVLCEKPIAQSSESAREMLLAAKRTGKTLSVSFQNRFREDSQAIRSACERGMLGDIYFAKAHAVRRKAVPTWGAFLNKSHQGGGPLIDIGVHALDLALWLMGNYEVKSVMGSVSHHLAPFPEGNIHGPWNPEQFEVEDAAFGLIQMKNGATIFLEAAWALGVRQAREAMTTLCGTRGGAEQLEGEFGPGSYTYNINTVMDSRLVTISPDPPHHYYWKAPKREREMMVEAPNLEFSQWFDALLEGRPPVVLPEEAYVVQRIVEAVYRSAETGKAIYFE